jgi:NADH:ubiquinone oxidoreductase subunit 4 (subunit M)
MPKLTIDGGENQIYSAFKFFLYRLLAILAIYLRTGSTDIVYALSLSPGDLRHPDPHRFAQHPRSEPVRKSDLCPAVALVLWMGIYPSSFLRPIRASVDHIVAQVHAATDAAGLRRASLP